ncbi:MAG: bifunctional folylpolyglutamate synthase/dihydrofolate synthase [Rickettsiales bacterium]|nr:bifunctional folylpolyglutamate synthase/dihydrofolate synthase [Rickettsiales bacterium]
MVSLPHWPRVGEVVIKNGLERISKMLDALGNPEKIMPPVIHFAGTNGKGSTVAFVQSILESAGLKVHVYTSPHLLRYNERIRLCGKEIEDGYLYSLLEECRIVSERNNIDVSFFEGTTAVAFLAFAREKADVVLLETGLGGRLDATNVITNPLVSVITPISFDHMAILGHDISMIAYEKAHIIKPNIPCVVSMQIPQVHTVIERYAELQNALLLRYEYDFGCQIRNDGFTYMSDTMVLDLAKPSLQGYHQFINASTAIAAVGCLSDFKINDIDYKRGIANAKWKGRLQRIVQGELIKHIPKEWELWIDGAHNEGGARVISSWLRDQSKEYKNVLILGMTKNRNINDFIDSFINTIEYVVGVPVYSEPISYRGEYIEERLTELGVSSASEESIAAALHNIVKKYGNDKMRVLITGSLFLVADFFVANKI